MDPGGEIGDRLERDERWWNAEKGRERRGQRGEQKNEKDERRRNAEREREVPCNVDTG